MQPFLRTLTSHPLWTPATRALLAAAYVAIIAASLAPKAYRPTSGMVPGALEHFAAYFVLGLLGAAASRGTTPWWRLALVNAVLAAILELAQLFVPGRIANIIDFAASATGSLLGIIAAGAVYRAWSR